MLDTRPGAPLRAHATTPRTVQRPLLRGALALVASFLVVPVLAVVGPSAAAAPLLTSGVATASGKTAATGTTAAQRRRALAVRGEKIIRWARAQAGDPYQYGAAGPNAFDCSGLTMFVFRNAVGERLPHSSSAQVSRTTRISRAAARRGDLVFFHDGGDVYHVAIYAGRNQVWHSPRPGSRVHRTAIWTSSVFFGRVR